MEASHKEHIKTTLLVNQDIGAAMKQCGAGDVCSQLEGKEHYFHNVFLSTYFRRGHQTL